VIDIGLRRHLDERPKGVPAVVTSFATGCMVTDAGVHLRRPAMDLRLTFADAPARIVLHLADGKVHDGQRNRG
jgi:hypothetical protein